MLRTGVSAPSTHGAVVHADVPMHDAVVAVAALAIVPYVGAGHTVSASPIHRTSGNLAVGAVGRPQKKSPVKRVNQKKARLTAKGKKQTLQRQLPAQEGAAGSSHKREADKDESDNELDEGEAFVPGRGKKYKRGD